MFEKLSVEKGSKASKMEELSGVMIVLIIGGGVLAVTICFIVAKRQIVRFTLRQRRGPHVAVGHDAKKSIKKEIERRIDCIQKIYYEPKLLWDDKKDGDKYILQPDSTLPPYYYRMKAMDDIQDLEREITKHDGSTRHPRDSLRAFLLITLAAPLNGSGQRLIHQFCDMYEHARHDPNEFGEDEYQAYQRLLKKLTDAAKMLKSFTNSRKSSPNRTPVKKQSKMQSLLDPSRLRPPPIGSSVVGGIGSGAGDAGNQNARLNLSLGVHLQNQQQQQELDENEILSISRYHGETGLSKIENV
ncbi:protein C1orf43 homolog isoform X2 [Toxorhynchites rutilus septentrionalis]|uniref:protein C1orf43 homolog isoform X2 n=1 Tax=Toxorhynchites rutilus septentrionalis TaxID=329112 RepID=UPI00247A3BC7|nr:protein C1orf43 homolog isoform X2 [Toxorhynchites rutilus septentrionalis]